jgi:plastocyanin
MRPSAFSSIRPAGLAALAAMIALGACGGDDGSTDVAPQGSTGGSVGQTLVIKDFTFQPANLTVAPGAKIVVRNEDGTAHTVTANDRSFDTGNIEGKAQKELTVSKAGQISYKCAIHQYMTGVIQVTGS